MGKIGKHVFKHYAESECPRQLFLDLAHGDAAWIAPYRDLVEDAHRRVSGKTLADLGHAYEQGVYALMQRNPATRASESAQSGAVVHVPLDAARLAAYGDELDATTPTLFLLEHAWPTPESFVRFLFDLAPDAPRPISDAPGPLRPDITVLRRPGTGPSPAVEVLPDGALRELPPAERDARVAIELIDIKHTHEQAVGKTHLVELLYYGIAMSALLREMGLHERFFVSSQGHGILPRRDPLDLSDLRAREPAALTVPLRWRDTAHLFEGARRKVIALHRAAPAPVESVAAHVQPACGRCAYVADCVASLKHNTGPDGWDVALLPFVRQGTAEQLRALGLSTVGSVAARARDLPRSGSPLPLYAEVPALELKARALVHHALLPATPENTAGERMLSLALPRYTDVELLFDLETDPTNDVVFAFGLLLSISASPRAGYAAAHDRWWAFWRAALASREKPDYAALDGLLDPAARDAGARTEAARHAQFAAFAKALALLNEAPGGALEFSEREAQPDAPAAGVQRVSYRYTYVNGGSRTGAGHRDGERGLVERCVETLHAVFTASLVYETYVAEGVSSTSAKGEAKTWFKRPNFAGFYWSREQLDHVQDLLERHLTALVAGPLRERFLALMSWVSPSGSGVVSAQQHRKVFNLREFVETSVGHPEIINVTWHGIDAALDDEGRRGYSRRFWAPHFNYMDFAAWHEYLEEPDANRQREQFERLGHEVVRKLWALQRILRRTRALAGEGISHTRLSPVSTLALTGHSLDRGAHAIGAMWMLYAQINGAMQELDAEYTRTTYPLQSIASLAAAEVTDPHWSPSHKRFSLSVAGLSSNVKLAEGDQVALMPESLRDAPDWRIEQCLVRVTSMVWNAPAARYDVEAEPTWQSAASHPLIEGAIPAAERWFLYPHANDPWIKPLTALLSRQSMGSSWLGHRLALLWRIGFESSLAKPAASTFGAPEVYLFAPTQLPAAPVPAEAPLQTTQHPPPDPSQADAIRVSLGSAITCIQGPPGTGKSQTIAALIDEFMLRRGARPARVLVTAFSYSALRVVIDKVRAARDAQGNATAAAATPLVWCRSESREPVADEPGLAHVVDLVLQSGKKAVVDDVTLDRAKGRRLDHALGERFVLFANAFSLAKLGTPSDAAKFDYELLSNGFGFDLIVIDEASQVPTSQLLASLALVRPATFTLRAEGLPAQWPLDDAPRIRALSLETTAPLDALTRVVIVGDDYQLPPVQPVEAPEKLRLALDSAFRFYVEGHGVAHRQLRTNYRSKPTIVEYTRRLEIYASGLEAFRARAPYAALPPPPADASAWVRRVLDDAVDVSTIIHPTQHETATSPLEASLAADLCAAFMDQMGVRDAKAERAFWADQIGIVAPHNAQGRLVTRALYDRLARPDDRRSALTDEELMRCLRATIYSVEKFQGSDRTLILGTVAISSRDQLAAEEAFIYDLNRFNVLTSRARQKMVLLCSRAFLDYVPNEREVFAHAARVRDFAYGFCDREETFTVAASNATVPITWRYRA